MRYNCNTHTQAKRRSWMLFTSEEKTPTEHFSNGFNCSVFRWVQHTTHFVMRLIYFCDSENYIVKLWLCMWVVVLQKCIDEQYNTTNDRSFSASTLFTPYLTSKAFSFTTKIGLMAFEKEKTNAWSTWMMDLHVVLPRNLYVSEVFTSQTTKHSMKSQHETSTN